MPLRRIHFDKFPCNTNLKITYLSKNSKEARWEQAFLPVPKLQSVLSESESMTEKRRRGTERKWTKTTSPHSNRKEKHTHTYATHIRRVWLLSREMLTAASRSKSARCMERETWACSRTSCHLPPACPERARASGRQDDPPTVPSYTWVSSQPLAVACGRGGTHSGSYFLSWCQTSGGVSPLWTLLNWGREDLHMPQKRNEWLPVSKLTWRCWF